MPLGAGINQISNGIVGTINGNETPNNYQNGVYSTNNTIDNPFPTGLLSPPHRNASYQQILLGSASQADFASQPSGETYQWNVAVEHQFPLGIALTAAYVGLSGEHLPTSGAGFPINPLPDSVMAKAAADPNCSTGNFGSCFLNEQVANPYYPYISQGVLENSKVTQNQLLRPFPQYGSIGAYSGHYVGISNYNGLQMTLQKRWQNGGTMLGSYTFSKQMTNAETLTTWLDSTGGGVAGYRGLQQSRRRVLALRLRRAADPGGQLRLSAAHWSRPVAASPSLRGNERANWGLGPGGHYNVSGGLSGEPFRGPGHYFDLRV